MESERQHIRLFRRVWNWYGKFERPIASIALVGGFVFNAVVLKRVDLFWENFWVVIHLLVPAICIILLNRKENEANIDVLQANNPGRLHFWLMTILQFFFGGLLSTFMVFYFRSATLSVAWPFFLLLILAFVANERFKRHYARLDFQITFFYLNLYLFFIFIVPIILHTVSTGVFIISGILSLLVLGVLLLILRKVSHERFKSGGAILIASIIGITVCINVFYFQNIIPPLPLSLERAGIYHDVERNRDGGYTVRLEPKTFLQKIRAYFDAYSIYHATAGEPIYAYTAIFSPIHFDMTVYHEWQHRSGDDWITLLTVPLRVTGGNEKGFRTYSYYGHADEGTWRVNVWTKHGQLIGRMTFKVEMGESKVPTELGLE